MLKKKSYLILLISLLPFGSIFSQETSEHYNYQLKPFKEIYSYPRIKDSASFIENLISNCHLYTEYQSHKGRRINYFKKIKIFGSPHEFYLIEYDFRGGSNSQFPWKNQFIFDAEGKLIKILSVIRLDLVKIFPNESPFLFGLSSTAHGNGWHEVYKMQSDGLTQIYDQFIGNRPQTYCTDIGYTMNIPLELYHKFSDINNDGFNDIIFYGKVSYSSSVGYHDKTIPVKYIFLYNPKTGHFTELEDYSKKYAYIYGYY